MLIRMCNMLYWFTISYYCVGLRSIIYYVGLRFMCYVGLRFMCYIGLRFIWYVGLRFIYYVGLRFMCYVGLRFTYYVGLRFTFYVGLRFICYVGLRFKYYVGLRFIERSARFGTQQRNFKAATKHALQRARVVGFIHFNTRTVHAVEVR